MKKENNFKYLWSRNFAKSHRWKMSHFNSLRISQINEGFFCLPISL